MRYLIFLLLPAFASAQGVVVDTTFFTTVNGQLYQTNRITYDDGTYSEQRILTDTARVVTITARKIEAQAQGFAETAARYAPYRRLFARAIAQDAVIKSQLGLSPLAELQTRHAVPLLDTLATWAFVNNGASSAATFTVTTQGLLRIKIGSDALRTVVILGDMLRIPTIDGQTQFLYKVRDGLWQDITGTYRLVRTSLRVITTVE